MKYGNVPWLRPHIPVQHFVAMPPARSMALQVLLFAVCHHRMCLALGYCTKGLTTPDTAEVLV